MPIMSKITASYLAGLIDGEGYIGFIANRQEYRTFYQPTLKVVMTDKNIIEWLRDSYGGYFYERKPKQENHKISYEWEISGKTLKEILIKIRPYLRIKQKQCDILLKKYKIQECLFKNLPHQNISQINEKREEKRICNLAYRDEQRKQIENLYLEIRKLNKRGI